MRVTMFPLLLTACVIGDEAKPVEDPVGPDEQRVTHDVVGVSVVMPATWSTVDDPVLFDTHGFFIRTNEDPHAHALARVSLAYRAKPSELEALVAEKLAQYPGSERVDLALPDG